MSTPATSSVTSTFIKSPTCTAGACYDRVLFRGRVRPHCTVLFVGLEAGSLLCRAVFYNVYVTLPPAQRETTINNTTGEH